MRALPVLAAVFVLAGCTNAVTSTGTPLSPRVTFTTTLPAPAGTSGYPAAWVLPDPAKTPGALNADQSLSLICPHVAASLEAARPTYAQEQAVYASYGITHHAPGQYEVDHLVPIELLGAPDDPRNLWAQPNDIPSPAAIQSEHLNPAFIHNSKDIVEDVLHRDVCSGKVPLAVAQQAIRTDWRRAYITYVSAS